MQGSLDGLLSPVPCVLNGGLLDYIIELIVEEDEVSTDTNFLSH